jgi:hypothetical protein
MDRQRSGKRYQKSCQVSLVLEGAGFPAGGGIRVVAIGYENGYLCHS